MKKQELYQQGDVLVFTVESFPHDASRVDVKDVRGIVLAEGEATGHAHTIETISTCDLFQDADKNLWLEVKSENVTIKHQEHKPITVPKGKYKIGIVEEIDPFSEEISKVKD